MPPPAPSTAGAPIEPLPTAVTGFVGAADDGPVDTPVTVTSAAAYHATFGPSLDADRSLGHAVDLFFANGGRQAVVVRAAGPDPAQLVPADGPGGVHALAASDGFDGSDRSGVTVLVLPGLTAAHTDQVRVALAWCAAYRAVLVLDLPPGPWTEDLRATVQRVGEHRERAAAYHPWVVVDGASVPPSGAVVGVIARTDAERGVWKAPAGVGLRGVDALTEPIDARGAEELTGAGVNVLRGFPGRGSLVWGARLVAGARTGDPAARYLSVRRLTDHVLTSVSVGLGFVREQTSEEALWARVRQLTADFLHRLWLQGALAGQKPEEAYGVRCGLGETMTEADVRTGQVVLSLWMAPVRAGEYDAHTLRFQARPSSQPKTGTPPVLAVDLGQVVSRYIGETEKNLSRVLDRAEGSGLVLEFDEADAVFGKRTEVRGAHDRYAGQETARLVERMAKERGTPVRWRRRPSDGQG